MIYHNLLSYSNTAKLRLVTKHFRDAPRDFEKYLMSNWDFLRSKTGEYFLREIDFYPQVCTYTAKLRLFGPPPPKYLYRPLNNYETVPALLDIQ